MGKRHYQQGNCSLALALDLLGDAVPASPFRQTRPGSATLRAGLASVPDVRSRWALALRGFALRRLEAVNLLRSIQARLDEPPPDADADDEGDAE